MSENKKMRLNAARWKCLLNYDGSVLGLSLSLQKNSKDMSLICR